MTLREEDEVRDRTRVRQRGREGENGRERERDRVRQVDGMSERVEEREGKREGGGEEIERGGWREREGVRERQRVRERERDRGGEVSERERWRDRKGERQREEESKRQRSDEQEQKKQRFREGGGPIEREGNGAWMGEVEREREGERVKVLDGETGRGRRRQREGERVSEEDRQRARKWEREREREGERAGEGERWRGSEGVLERVGNSARTEEKWRGDEGEGVEVRQKEGVGARVTEDEEERWKMRGRERDRLREGKSISEREKQRERGEGDDREGQRNRECGRVGTGARKSEDKRERWRERGNEDKSKRESWREIGRVLKRERAQLREKGGVWGVEEERWRVGLWDTGSHLESEGARPGERGRVWDEEERWREASRVRESGLERDRTTGWESGREWEREGERERRREAGRNREEGHNRKEDGRGRSEEEGESCREGQWEGLSGEVRSCRHLPHLFCPLHEEELKLFCETDGKLICGICRDSREHKYHHYIPVNEALDIYQDKLKSHLETARRRRAAALKARLQQRQKMSEVREQSSSLQSHIKFEFTRMHRFLNEREEQLSRDLREAEGRILEEMEQNLQQIQDALDAIERVLGELQSQVNQQDIMVLLKEESIWNRRFSDKGSSLETVDLNLPLGIFKGPLQYAAWQAMIDVIRPVPVPLTLNPDTANSWLILSEDLHSVRMGQQRRTVPESADRFDRCACVLAMEGFSTGQHYWEVEVGQKTEWDLGVARKSCQRKGRIRRYPDDGYWRLSLRRQNEYTVFTDPPTLLNLIRSPRTVGMYLDYEGGQLSFYDADGMVHLHTFTDTFTETLYPYFCPCLGDGGKNLEAMKICWVKSPTQHKVPETLIRQSLSSGPSPAGSLQEPTPKAILR